MPCGHPQAFLTLGAGGLSPVSCLGYADCAREMVEQEQATGESFAHIMIANGSSGIHAELAAGLAAMGLDPARVRSFTVLAAVAEARKTTFTLARATLALLDAQASIEAAAIDVSGDQRGADYGLPTAAMFEAVRLLARAEGLLLDPVYSGKAFAGLLADVGRGVVPAGGSVLFILMGGTPGPFAYRPAFDAV